MKQLLLIFVAALAAFAQDAKVEPKAVTPAPTPTERLLSETEVLKLQLAAEKIKNLQTEFRIEEYSKKYQPIAQEQKSIAVAACVSIGIPKDKVETECGLSVGQVGPDGKDLPGRVFWNKPPVAAEKK